MCDALLSRSRRDQRGNGEIDQQSYAGLHQRLRTKIARPFRPTQAHAGVRAYRPARRVERTCSRTSSRTPMRPEASPVRARNSGSRLCRRRQERRRAPEAFGASSACGQQQRGHRLSSDDDLSRRSAPRRLHCRTTSTGAALCRASGTRTQRDNKYHDRKARNPGAS